MQNIKQKLRFIILPFIGGLLYAIGFPTGFVPLNFLGPILGLCLFFYAHPRTLIEKSEISWKKQMGSVLLFCLAANLISYYWIPKTIGVFGNIPAPFNFILGLFFTLLVLPHLFIFSLFYRKLLELKTNVIKNNLIFNLILAIVLILFERFTPQQFPAHSGHSWIIIAPYLGLATVFGVPAFSFINIFLALGIRDMLIFKKMIWTPIIIFSLFLAVNLALPLKNKDNDLHHDLLRLVQADIGSLMKVDSESGKTYATQEVIDAYTQLSLLPSNNKKIDLIIWPETAYPNMLQAEALIANPNLIPRVFKHIIEKSNAELLLGGYDFSLQDYNSDFFESQYNAVFHFSKDIQLKEVYRKMKLIPFGESLPFGSFNKIISQYIQNISYFAAGKKYPLFKTQNDTTFFVAICYEILFSSFIRNYLNELTKLNKSPRFMINITNDSWYGDTSEPYQHLYLARWRALEFDIPIVRLANTGISSILYPDGSQSERLMIGEKNILDINLKTHKRHPTIFERFGLLTTFLMILLIALLLNMPMIKNRNLQR